MKKIIFVIIAVVCVSTIVTLACMGVTKSMQKDYIDEKKELQTSEDSEVDESEEYQNVSRPTVEVVSKQYPTFRAIKVACVGDSITRNGYWENNLYNNLDSDFEVKGFGVNGATALSTGRDQTAGGTTPKAYIDQEEYKQSLQFEPDIVVIMLGTNDSKNINWGQVVETKGDDFIDDYIELIESYQELSSKPRIFVALPPTVFKQFAQITNETIESAVIPAVKVAASATGAIIIDTHSANALNPNDFSDGVHPSTEQGRKLLADVVAKAIIEDVTGVK